MNPEKRTGGRWGLVGWLLSIALSLPACAPGAEAGPRTGAAEPVAGFPRTVDGFAGERLVLAAPPTRIVPANGGAADFVLALVGPDRIAALAPASVRFSVAAHELPGLEDRVRPVGFGPEDLLAVAPDLVICHNWQDRGTVDFLRSVGVPVLVLPEVRGPGDLVAVLVCLGQALGREDRAAEVVQDLELRIAALAARPPLAEPRVLSYSNFGSGGSTAGRGTTFDLLCSLAGLVNVAAAANIEGHGPLVQERLFELDPDWLLVSGSEDDPARSASEEYLRQEPGLAGLRALAEDRLIRLPMELATTNSHHLVRAAEVLRDELDARAGGG